jgi:hypothetical protein
LRWLVWIGRSLPETLRLLETELGAFADFLDAASS